jgi:hypothetical protein
VLDNYTFTLILDIKYKSFEMLSSEGIYLFCGRGWLVSHKPSPVYVYTGQCQAYSQMVDYSDLFFTDGKDEQEIILCLGYCESIAIITT